MRPNVLAEPQGGGTTMSNDTVRHADAVGSSEWLGLQPERAAFETWFSDGGKWPAAVRRSGEGYMLAAAQSAWSAWKAAWAAKLHPLSDDQIERGREATFSTSNPFCPCDSKTMRNAVRWAEHVHGIKA